MWTAVVIIHINMQTHEYVTHPPWGDVSLEGHETGQVSLLEEKRVVTHIKTISVL